jgi:hypothetical protein
MKAHHNLERKVERKQWLKRKEQLIEVFGGVAKAAGQLGCHPNSLRNIDACPDIKKKLDAAIARKLAGKVVAA